MWVLCAMNWTYSKRKIRLHQIGLILQITAFLPISCWVNGRLGTTLATFVGFVHIATDDYWRMLIVYIAHIWCPYEPAHDERSSEMLRGDSKVKCLRLDCSKFNVGDNEEMNEVDTRSTVSTDHSGPLYTFPEALAMILLGRLWLGISSFYREDFSSCQRTYARLNPPRPLPPSRDRVNLAANGLGPPPGSHNLAANVRASAILSRDCSKP